MIQGTAVGLAIGRSFCAMGMHRLRSFSKPGYIAARCERKGCIYEHLVKIPPAPPPPPWRGER